ncbi:MAG: threonine synthase [Ignavibacteria bacterium]|jgi:threonine synthase|nr:threonine synthase [Ignavibacteria bacterium]MCU7502314.1 threonine synthase [Ignavibacteria bacterium]MCU7516642.1 threonine synthase [Ignavibacteria bacterium]
MKDEFIYECSLCGKTYPISRDIMLCPECRESDLRGRPLKGVLKVKMPGGMENSKNPGEAFDVHDYLPIEKKFFPGLPVGNTPLIKAHNLEKLLAFQNIYLKFDALNPTGSFKDRASYLVSASAKKWHENKIVVSSTGNAASSMCGIAAAAAQRVFVFMPWDAPRAKLVQCLQYGACLIPVKGTYDDAFDLSLEFSKRTGILNRNTAYNPMTLEGKKTASFEILRQMKGRKISHLFLPVGDGVVLSGIVKGFCDLKFLGLTEEIPCIVGVQAETSSFLYSAFYEDKIDLNYKARTAADSISVNVARNAYTAVKDLREVKGKMLLVSDNEILDSQRLISEATGLFCEPSSAAAFAGFLKMKDSIPPKENVVVLLTGHGLKDIEFSSKKLKFPGALEPDIDLIIKKLGLKESLIIK